MYKRKMPSIPAIIKYYRAEEKKSLGSLYTDEDSIYQPNTCWKCQKEGYVERAHIVPHYLEGNDSPSNLYLLCPLCHKESHYIEEDKQTFFDWLWIPAGKVMAYAMYNNVKPENLFSKKDLMNKILPWDSGLYLKTLGIPVPSHK